MSEQELEEILEFRKVISMINKELHSKGVFDIEYMLVNNSISDVLQVLSINSTFYNLIKDDKYKNGGSFKELLEVYFEYVKKKYESLLIKDGKNDRIADKYYDKLKEPVQRNGTYLQYSKNDIGMIQRDVEKTLILMREAIQAYYKVYNNKVLVAELTTNNTKSSDYLEFIIEEERLLHLLGVTAKQLKSNPDFIRLTGRSNMDSIQILEWIIKDTEGNNDLIQYSDDFLKRISSGSFELSKNQFENATQTRLLNYYKVRAKSQAFLKYGPFEKVSLVAKLQDGKKLAVNAKSNTAMISQAECFKKYPWAYFGSVQEPGKKYMETLVIDSSTGKKELFKGSTPAIVKRVGPIDGDDGGTGGGGKIYKDNKGGGTGGSGGHIFSDDEQFDLFCAAYEDFQDAMDFTNLKEYFTDLYRNKIVTQPNKVSKDSHLTISQEIVNKILNLDYESTEKLYEDIVELTFNDKEEMINNDYSIAVYQQEILRRIKQLNPNQILEISSRISGNKYTSMHKKR